MISWILNNKDNIAFLLSVISILITSINFISKKWSERINIEAKVKQSYGYRDAQNVALNIAVINNSKLPVSISQMELVVQFVNGPLTAGCIGINELFIRQKTGGVITKETFFSEVPFYIAALGNKSGWYRFEFDHIPLTTNLDEFKCKLRFFCHGKIKELDIVIPKATRVIG